MTTDNAMQFFAYHPAEGATKEDIAASVYQYFDEGAMPKNMINDSINAAEVVQDLKNTFSQLHGVEDVPEEFRDMQEDTGESENAEHDGGHDLFDGNGIAIHAAANCCSVQVPFILDRYQAQSTLGLARDIFARLKHHHGYLIFDVRSREVVTELDWEGSEEWSRLA